MREKMNPRHENLIYLDGEYVDYEKATVSVENRGLLFGHGVYEVMRIVGGRVFEFDAHLERLTYSLKMVGLELKGGADKIVEVTDELLNKNQLVDATIYWQFSAGAAGFRSHVPYEKFETHVMAMAKSAAKLSIDDELEVLKGGAILHADDRWGNCNIKAITLLPNIIAKQKAHEAGATEAILVKDGLVTEGTSTAVLRVKDGVIQVHPSGKTVLPSITGKVVERMAEEMGIPFVERAFCVEELFESDELMVVGTVSKIKAVLAVDGKVIGDGRPGDITKKLHRGLHEQLVGLS